MGPRHVESRYRSYGGHRASRVATAANATRRHSSVDASRGTPSRFRLDVTAVATTARTSSSSSSSNSNATIHARSTGSPRTGPADGSSWYTTSFVSGCLVRDWPPGAGGRRERSSLDASASADARRTSSGRSGDDPAAINPTSVDARLTAAFAAFAASLPGFLVLSFLVLPATNTDRSHEFARTAASRPRHATAAHRVRSFGSALASLSTVAHSASSDSSSPADPSPPADLSSPDSSTARPARSVQSPTSRSALRAQPCLLSAGSTHLETCSSSARRSSRASTTSTPASLSALSASALASYRTAEESAPAPVMSVVVVNPMET